MAYEIERSYPSEANPDGRPRLESGPQTQSVDPASTENAALGENAALIWNNDFFGSGAAPDTTRRGIVGWAELEVPNGPRRGIIGWAELEVPNGPRRGIVGWAELEVPNAPAPRRAIFGWAEVEVPTAPRRAIVGWAELEVPDASARRAIIGWAEFQVPTPIPDSPHYKPMLTPEFDPVPPVFQHAADQAFYALARIADQDEGTEGQADDIEGTQFDSLKPDKDLFGGF